MKRYLKHIKAIVFVVIIGLLFGFSTSRNKSKTIEEVELHFLNGEHLFITYETVNKLLIQNYGVLKSQPKETIILSSLESVLQSNEMIEDADVFLTVDGKLCASIKQRTPIARVNDEGVAYYIDSRGEKMPLSSNYSARVPMVSGVNGKDHSKVYLLAKLIYQDEFLHQQIIGIEQNDKDEFVLKTRIGGQRIELGLLNNLNRKIAKLKVFYQKKLKEQTLGNYQTINLVYKDQVVCTKK